MRAIYKTAFCGLCVVAVGYQNPAGATVFTTLPLEVHVGHVKTDRAPEQIERCLGADGSSLTKQTEPRVCRRYALREPADPNSNTIIYVAVGEAYTAKPELDSGALRKPGTRYESPNVAAARADRNRASTALSSSTEQSFSATRAGLDSDSGFATPERIAQQERMVAALCEENVAQADDACKNSKILLGWLKAPH